MDYTKQIFEMLGIEPEEEFKLDKSDKVYKIDRLLNLLVFTGKQYVYLSHGDTTLIDILRGEYKIVKIPHPTAEEQLAIDYARACGCKWIAKDEDKQIFAYPKKPYKDIACWSGEYDDDNIEIQLPISFIHWEDEEPFYIGEDEIEKTEVKKVCEHYSEGKCMAQIHHPNVVCEGNKNRCYAG